MFRSWQTKRLPVELWPQEALEALPWVVIPDRSVTSYKLQGQVTGESYDLRH